MHPRSGDYADGCGPLSLLFLPLQEGKPVSVITTTAAAAMATAVGVGVLVLGEPLAATYLGVLIKVFGWALMMQGLLGECLHACMGSRRRRPRASFLEPRAVARGRLEPGDPSTAADAQIECRSGGPGLGGRHRTWRGGAWPPEGKGPAGPRPSGRSVQVVTKPGREVCGQPKGQVHGV